MGTVWSEARGRASPNFGPEVGFNLVSGVRAHPQIFSKVKLQSARRVLRDLFQPGATLLGFSNSNSTYVLTKNQGGGEILSEAVAIFSHNQL